MKTVENFYSIPILLIVFKRPETTRKVFEKIKKIRPQKLYVACDGARKNVQGEEELVQQTKNLILNNIDWDCQLFTKFEKKNLGCKDGVYTAINWLFESEDMGIILEDDCVVQDSFFPFMKDLLERYRLDERIGMIDGANYIKKISIPYSYCFSRFKSTNGWGTWKRAWKNMDIDMKWRNTPMEKSILWNAGFEGKDLKYWKYRLKVIDCNQASAWDWQWYFTLSANNQLSIFPKYSLVSNIGFGEGATHTTERKLPDYYMADKELTFPLSHPPYVFRMP